MTPAFEKVQKILRQLPGLGYRSAERIALALLVEKPESLDPVVQALLEAKDKVRSCERCGNVAEEALCVICKSPHRQGSSICVVECVPDLVAMERSGAYDGGYHVLQGRLSPLRKVGPEDLNLASLKQRLDSGEVDELILALSNDIEGEATCHYIQESLIGDADITVTRIGFGLPSGGDLNYADSATLKSALEGRRCFTQ
tara:strand:+ start:18449 stop:19048 length:600 start_codon:yes stop_codon:yes gene_type:complete